jgi:hypothetical protein
LVGEFHLASVLLVCTLLLRLIQLVTNLLDTCNCQIPRRNPNFTGRDNELTQLHARFLSQDLGRKAVVKVEVAGMGGVGKSQLCTEYCYRYFPTEYGLVVWVNAETSDTLVADYRQLLADLASDNKMDVVDINKSSEDVVCEVKTRLFRCSVPWLLVLDNLEDHHLLDKFVPHGAGTRGHVLVTTRHVDVESGSEHSGNLTLGCFSTSESLDLLRRSVGSHNMEGPENEVAAHELSERLGNLPLALGMASAYMRRCDVQVSEYLHRYNKGSDSLLHGKLNDYSLSVASSLSLSLEEVEKLSPVACDVLKMLSFLAPDQISKSLIRHLLSAKKHFDDKKCQSDIREDALQQNILVFCGLFVGGSLLLTKRTSNNVKVGLIAASAAMVSTAMYFRPKYSNMLDDTESYALNKVSSATFSPSEYELSDLAWNLLKSFSLLTVKDGKGSVHRLLQHAMRSCQSNVDARNNLTICLDAMKIMWKFKANETDTWNDSLSILEHVKASVSHCLDYPLDTIHKVEAGHLSKDTVRRMLAQ